MTESELDPQELAAFMEGRIDGVARERVVRILARSDDSYDVFAEAMKVAEELNLPIAPTREPRLVRLTRSIRGRRIQLAAAAVVVLAVGSFTLQRILTSVGPLLVPATSIVATFEANELSSLPAGWDNPGWSVTRGGPARFVEAETAFRIGVRILDIHIAIRRSNPAEAGFYTAQIIDLLQNVIASQPIQISYRQLQAAIGSGVREDSLLPLAEQAERQTDLVLGSPYIGLGKWIEGARIAILLEDAEFFVSDDTQRFLNRLDDVEYSEDISSLMHQLRGFVDSGVDVSDLPELSVQVDGIVEAAGG